MPLSWDDMFPRGCTQCIESSSVFPWHRSYNGQRRWHWQAKLHSCPILQFDSWGTAEIEGPTNTHFTATVYRNVYP